MSKVLLSYSIGLVAGAPIGGGTCESLEICLYYILSIFLVHARSLSTFRI